MYSKIGCGLMKKGFTLIELLAVIVVLGLIAVIAIPTVTSSLKNYQKKLLNTQIVNIENAARTWGAKHLTELPTITNTSIVKNYDELPSTEEYGVLVINLKLLQDEGLIESNIKNPVSKKVIDENTPINITNLGNSYSYELKLED